MWYSRLWGTVLERLTLAQGTLAVLQAEERADEGAHLTAADLLSQVDLTACLLHPYMSEQRGRRTSPTPPIVGIFLTNSAYYVAAVLAALKSGAAFLPLDPRWPPHRLQQVIAEARPAAVLWAPTHSPGGHGPPPTDVPGLSVVQLTPPPLVDGASRPGLVSQQDDCVALRGDAAGHAALPALARTQQPAALGRPGTAVAGEAQPRRPLPFCYVMFTSGSTGTPLGVCETEQGILNRCRWMQRDYPLGPGDRVAFKTSPCFVDSIWEVFGPLLAGVPLVALPQPALLNPPQLLGLCCRHRLTHLVGVPTLWEALMAHLERAPGLAAGMALRVAVASGEPLGWPLLARMQRLLPPGTAILNLYGSTEVAADCTAFDCSCWQQPGPVKQLPTAGAAGAVGTEVGPGSPAAGTPPAYAREGTTRQPRLGQLGAYREMLSAAASWVPVGTPILGMFVGIASSEAAAATPPAEQEVPAGMGTAQQQGQRGGQLQTPLCFLPAGSVGEVVVGGVGLATGYLNQPAATARRFIQLPRAALPASLLEGWKALEASRAGPDSLGAVGGAGRIAADGEAAAAAEERGGCAAGGSVRLFVTGDLGYLDDCGRLRLCGRRDLQVKISGVRVDLTEVEAVLSQHPAVHAAAARLWALHAGPALAGYVELLPASAMHPPLFQQPLTALVASREGATTPSHGQVPTSQLPTSPQPLLAPAEPSPLDPSTTLPEQLVAWCAQRLPPAAVPAAIVVLPCLPRSAGGKVQRAGLPLPHGWQQAQQAPADMAQQAQHTQQGGTTAPCQPPAARQHGPAPPATAGGAAGGEGGTTNRAAKRARQEGRGRDNLLGTTATQPPLQGSAGLFLPGASSNQQQQQQPGTILRSPHPPSEARVARAFAAALQRSTPAGSLPPLQLEPTTNIFSVGASSLAVAAIALELDTPAELIYECPSVRSLAARLRAAAGAVGAAQGHHAPQEGSAGSAGTQQGLSLLELARPLLDLHPQTGMPASDQGWGMLGEPGEARRRVSLQLAWHCRMLQCVDAPPLAATLPAATRQQLSGRHSPPLLQVAAARDGSGSSMGTACSPPAGESGLAGGSDSPWGGRTNAPGPLGRVFACSHGGDVCCFEATTGVRLWEVVLPDRTDVGLVLCAPHPLAAPATDAAPVGLSAAGPSPALPAGRSAEAAEAAGSRAQAQQLPDPGAAARGVRTGVGVKPADAVAELGVPGGRPLAPLQGPCVAVGTNGGTVVFLDAHSGSVVGSVDTGGGLRAAPVVDPWHGMLWVANHAKQLLVIEAPGVVVGRQQCSAAVSAQVAFHAQQRLAYVACLDGGLMAVRAAYPNSVCRGRGCSSFMGGTDGVGGATAEVSMECSPAGAAGKAGEPPLPPPPMTTSLQLSVEWRSQCSAPLFASPVVFEDGPPAGGGLVVAAAVDGSITAMEAASGRMVWRCQAGSAVFAPLIPLSMHSMGGGGGGSSSSGEATVQGGRWQQRRQQRGRMDQLGGQPPEVQEHRSPQHRALACSEEWILAGTQAGELCLIHAHTGAVMATVSLAAKITGICALSQPLPLSLPPGWVPSPPPAHPPPATAPSASGSAPAFGSHVGPAGGGQPLVFVTTQPGVAFLLDAQALVGGAGARQLLPPGSSGSGSGSSGEAHPAGGVAGPGTAEAECLREGIEVEPEAAGVGRLRACLLDVVRLPGEVFSVPSAAGVNGAVVGCRDDHLYCLRLECAEGLG